MKLIPNEKILKIPIKDNGEKLVNLKEFCHEIIINIHPKSRRIQRLPKDTCYVRESVAKRLCKAQKSLPKDYHLMVWEGHRPLKVQEKMYSDFITN
jgi:hypothetical protein